MSQPQWQFVANLGDAHPLTYGGYFVYRDATGVYPPEAEVIEPPADDIGLDSPKAQWTVYRFPCDPCQDPDSEWFGDSLDTIAAQFDPPMDIRADLKSDDPVRLASAYREIGEYDGFKNFDEYPLVLTREEMAERYPDHADELGLEDWQIGGTVRRDEYGRVIMDIKTCGHCGFRWNDAIITGRTPAPSARCPMESEHEYDEDKDEDFPPNLDAMEQDELRILADDLADLNFQTDLPNGVRAALIRYCSLRIVAMEHRLAGRIQASLEVGHQMDALYRQIPESYRW